MKKIAVLGGIVIVLIAVIKLGGVFMEPSNKETTEASAATEETSPTLLGQTPAKDGELVTIEINNGTEAGMFSSQGADAAETLGQETQEASAESSPAAAGSATTAAVSSTTAAGGTTATASYQVTPMTGKTMYATRSVHVRKGPSTDMEVVSGLGPGQKVTATGESSNGWIRISYNGGEAYVYKTYLSTDKADVIVETTAAKTTTKPKATSAAKETTAKATKPAAPTTAAAPAPAPSDETIAPFPGN